MTEPVSNELIKDLLASLNEGRPEAKTMGDCLRELLAIRESITIGYVGVENGLPVFRKCSDETGDSHEFSVYQQADEALERFYNVRSICLLINREPVRHPEDWGAIG